MESVFLGTPESAVPSLEALDRISHVLTVITRPDRPRGRSRAPEPSPVARRASELGLSVAKPEARADLVATLQNIDADVAVVAAFGMILPAAALEAPRHGMVNVHYSLLPRWRGAAPVERAILAGDPTTGVTLMALDEGLDTGPTLAAWETSIGADETGGELTERLARAGGELLARHLGAFVSGALTPQSQDDTQATYASRLSTDEAALDLSRPAVELAAAIRAFNPRPGAHVSRQGQRFKILRARPAPGSLPIGELAVDDGRILLGTGEGTLELTVVQPAGSRAMAAVDWARGVRGPLGALA